MFHNFFLSYASKCDMDLVLEALRQYCKNIIQDSSVKKFLQNTLLVSFSSDFLSITKNFQQDIPLLWYFGTYEWYEINKHSIKKDTKVIVCNWVLLDYFIYDTALLGGGALPKLRNDKRNIYGIGHSMAEAFYYAPLREKKEYLDVRVYNAFCAFSHYIAINKDSKRAFKSMFDAVGLEVCVVEGGYPRFDNRFQKRQAFKCNKEQFLFIPRLSKPHELLEIISYLLDNGKKVLLRRHGAYENYIKWQGLDDPYKVLEAFKQDPNFSFDETPSITNEILDKSIVVTDNSSVAYSAPLVSLTPCILYSIPKNEFDLRIRNYGISFANPLLHRVALDDEEFFRVSLDLETELSVNSEKITKEIQDYVLDNFYNLGCSAEMIAKTLLESFKKQQLV